MASPIHLAGRFFGSLRPGPPSRSDNDWAESNLLPAEVAIWREMWNPDRRHAVGVARRVAASPGDAVTRPVLAAALLHDCGKTDAHLHTYGRVVATLSAGLVRHDEEAIRDWTRSRGFTRRIGLYLQHPRLGGDRLALAGSDALTEAWAREHHSPPEQWTVPAAVGAILKAADDD